MADLADEEFELDGLLMGPLHPIWVEGLSIGDAELRVQDSLSPTSSRTTFGDDYASGPVWDLTMGVSGDDSTEALTYHRQLTRHWRDISKRRDGVESVLRYSAGGETRRVYGRARGKTFNPNQTLDGGYLAADAQFIQSDDLYYTDTPKQITLNLLAGEDGGFMLDETAILPIDTLPGGERTGPIDDVGGDAPTPHIIAVVHGPVNRPVLKGPGWQIAMEEDFGETEFATIDIRRMDVYRNNGQPVQLSHDTWLDDVVLHPGASAVDFSGYSVTGTARCDFLWHPAWYDF